MSQKEPLSRTLSALIRQRALVEINRRGTPLPGKVVSVVGPIVTVQLLVQGLSQLPVSMPVVGAEYDRLPIQPGDLGEAWPAVVCMGAVTGLGTNPGNVDMTPQGNLASLLWVPVGNKNLAPSPDGTARVIYGAPNGVGGSGKGGVILMDGTKVGGALAPVAELIVNTDGVSINILNTSKTISFAIGSTTVTATNTSITLTASGHTLLINATGISLDGKVFAAHEHTGVTTGTGTSGPVA